MVFVGWLGGRIHLFGLAWTGSLAFHDAGIAAVGSSTERDSENCIRVY
jgi:hypothetical protein